MSLLTMIQTACQEIGIPVPNAVLTSADPQIIQLAAIATRECKELASFVVKDSCWSVLQKQWLFTTSYVSVPNCNITAGSAIVTMPSNAGIVKGMALTGPVGSGLATSALVLSVDVSGTFITMDQVATGTALLQSLNASQINYPAPSDYDHATNQTFWDRNYRWQMLGPLTPQEWQVLKSGVAPTGPRRRFRFIGNVLVLDPPPVDNTIMVYEYISNGFAIPASSTLESNPPYQGPYQTAFLLDTDVSVLNEDLITLGIMWRWKRAKGFAYDEEYKIYTDTRQRLASRDGGGVRSLVMNRQFISSPLITSAQIPDAGFGVPSS
jgi:hypothetical protein